LETLPLYDTPGDAEMLDRYVAGEMFPEPAQPTEWTRFIDETVRSGREMPHVRLITEPLSTYLRSGVDWFFPHHVAAGRDLRILRPTARAADEARSVGDFWLFDKRVAAQMHYGPNGTFEGVQLHSDMEAVNHYRRLRDRLMDEAIPFQQWLADWRARTR
jgi:hypothetical protein